MIFFSPAKITIKRMKQKFEILVITNTVQKHKCKIYLDIRKKNVNMPPRDGQLKGNAKQTNEDNTFLYSSFKQFCLPVLVFLVP